MKKRKVLRILLIILISLIISLIIFLISLKINYTIKENINKSDINRFKKLYGDILIGEGSDVYYHGYSSGKIKIRNKKDFYLKVSLECALSQNDTRLIVELIQNISYPRSKMNYFSLRNKVFFYGKQKDRYLIEKINYNTLEKIPSEYPKSSPVPAHLFLDELINQKSIVITNSSEK